MAGSSHTLTSTHDIGGLRRIVTDWTADDTDASIPTLAIGFQGRIVRLITDPGSTAPTSNYDITLVDGNGVDQLQGGGANRHTSNTEEVLIVYSGTNIHPVVWDQQPLTVTLANNAVNSATGTITIDYEPIPTS